MRRILVLCGVVGVVLLSGCSQPDDNVLRSAMSRYDRCVPLQLAAGPGAPEQADVRTDVGDGDATLTAMGAMLAQSRDQGQGAESSPPKTGKRTFTPWRDRRGPAYPGDLWRSFGRDAKEILPTMWDDTKATFTNPVSLVGIGAAGVAGIVINAGGVDDTIAGQTGRHPHKLGKFWDQVGDVGGNPGLHFAIAGTMYFTSLARDDVKTYEISKTMINALAINGLTTLALKGLVRTRSPNGDPWGWPSGHTSSTFTIATVLYEEYGPAVGLPAFAFAAFVGYERIDARNHDFSDVVSGALIGMAIGHAVCQNHQAKIFGMDVAPYVDPERGAVGVALTKRW